MQVLRGRHTEQVLQEHLARGGCQQVVAAHHLGHTLHRVVDDHGEVVGRHPVASSQHHVVDEPGDVTGQPVVDRELEVVGPQPQCRGPSGPDPLGPLRLGEGSAGAGVGPVGEVDVGRARGGVDLGPDLAPRAEAGVDEVASREFGDRRLVAIETFALADHLAVVVDAQGGEIGELAELVLGGRGDAVEILHPDQETAAAGSGREPRDERRAQVAQMQVTRR